MPSPASSAPGRPAALGVALDAEAALRRRIEAEINEAPCTTDSQCKTLAVGEKACGGTEDWLAWSTLAGRPEVLQSLAGELTVMQRRRNQRLGLLSDCRHVPDPGAICRAQRCVLRPSGSAN